MKFTVELQGHTLAPEDTANALLELLRANGYTYVSVEHEQIDMLSLSFFAPEPDMRAIHKLMEDITTTLAGHFNISLHSTDINSDPSDKEEQLMGVEGYCQLRDNRLLFCQYSRIAGLIEQLSSSTSATRFYDLSDIPDCRSVRFVQELADMLGIEAEQADATGPERPSASVNNPLAEMIDDLLDASVSKAFNSGR